MWESSYRDNGEVRWGQSSCHISSFLAEFPLAGDGMWTERHVWIEGD